MLHHIIEGLTEDAIADRLFISPHTVRWHIKNLYQKLHVHSRAEVVRAALERRFRQYFGVGIDEFKRGVRADRAHRLLAETGVPITQVALLAGYSDQSHLTRSMRRYYHATPVMLRRRRGSRVQVGGIQDLGSHAP